MDDNDIYTHLFRLLDRMIRLCVTEEQEAEEEQLPATPQARLSAKHIWAEMLRMTYERKPVAFGSIRYDPAAIQTAARTRHKTNTILEANRHLREERARLLAGSGRHSSPSDPVTQ